MRVELKRVKLADRFVTSATTGGGKSPIFMDDGLGSASKSASRPQKPHP